MAKTKKPDTSEKSSQTVLGDEAPKEQYPPDPSPEQAPGTEAPQSDKSAEEKRILLRIIATCSGYFSHHVCKNADLTVKL